MSSICITFFNCNGFCFQITIMGFEYPSNLIKMHDYVNYKMHDYVNS